MGLLIQRWVLVFSSQVYTVSSDSLKAARISTPPVGHFRVKGEQLWSSDKANSLDGHHTCTWLKIGIGHIWHRAKQRKWSKNLKL